MARVSCTTAETGLRRARPGQRSTMGTRVITPEEKQLAATLLERARAAMRAIESYDQRGGGSSLSGRRVGDRERGHGDAAGGDERRGERPGQPGAEPPRQGAGNPARCAAAEEHGDHRGDSREGHRQVREAGRCHRLADSGHQPLRDADRHRHLRDQVQGCGHLLAAPGEPPHHQRGRPADARGAAPAGCA